MTKTALMILASVNLVSGLVPAARAAGAGKQKVLLLALRNQERSSKKAVAVICSHVLDLDVSIQVRWLKPFPPGLPSQMRQALRLARASGAFVVLWCDFSLDDPVTVYVLDVKNGRALVRSVSKAKEGPQGIFEAIGTIARNSVQALRKDGRIGIVPSLKRVGHQPTRFTHVPVKGVSAFLETAYTLSVYSQAELALHGGYLGLNIVGGRHWSVVAGYVFYPELSVTAHQTTVYLARHPLVLGGRFQAAMGRRFSLAGQLHIGLDIQHRHAEVHSLSLTPEPAAVDVNVCLGGQLMVSFEVKSGISLRLVLGADFYLVSRDYAVYSQGRELMVIQPWVVQPYLLVGASFRIM